MHESEKWRWSRSVVSDPQRPHGLQPSRLLHPWDFPGKSTGVGWHFLLQTQLEQVTKTRTTRKKPRNTVLGMTYYWDGKQTQAGNNREVISLLSTCFSLNDFLCYFLWMGQESIAKQRDKRKIWHTLLQVVLQTEMAPGMSYFLPCNLGDHFNCPLEILTTIFTRWHKMTSDDLWGSFNFRSYDLIKLIQLTIRNQGKTFHSNGPGSHSKSSPESSLSLSPSGNPLQYSCQDNSMDSKAWQATVHAIAKSQTWLSNWACTA